jgi:hypothetical protein
MLLKKIKYTNISQAVTDFKQLLLAPVAEKKVRYHIGKILKGQDCLLIGSAPNPDLSLYKNGMSIVTVNGSAANAKSLGLPTPKLTVIDYELIDPECFNEKESRRVIIENKLLKDLDLGTLVAVQSNSSKGGAPSVLEAKFDQYTSINKAIARKIVHRVTDAGTLSNDVHGLLSQGGMAIALCFWLGARSVTISGFSLFKKYKSEIEPHFYSDLPISLAGDFNWDSSECGKDSLSLDTRSHTLADCSLVTQLVLRGFEVRTAEQDFLPLTRNWGRSPPDWAVRKKFRNH